MVRHALPGERIRARVTSITSKVSRADAIEIMTPSPDRIKPACPYSGPSGCGGCDFQHVALPAQRGLKAQVVSDAFRRFAGTSDINVSVEPVPGDVNGLGWRTRVTWQVDADGRLGFHQARSHEVLPVDTCLLASPGIAAWRRTAAPIPRAARVRTAEDSDGATAVSVDGEPLQGPMTLHQRVLDRRWDLPVPAFWQVHPGAAEALVRAVTDFGRPRAGERWWDLYAGAGLFSAFLGETVGPTGVVDSVEGFAASALQARQALSDLPAVRVTHADVHHWVQVTRDQVDGVVLDPPRSGAGAPVVRAIAAAHPARVVYVACDPVALARDVASFRDHGYGLAKLAAFDCFPMTHHVECVALLTGP